MGYAQIRSAPVGLYPFGTLSHFLARLQLNRSHPLADALGSESLKHDEGVRNPTHPGCRLGLEPGLSAHPGPEPRYGPFALCTSTLCSVIRWLAPTADLESEPCSLTGTEAARVGLELELLG